MRGRFFFIIFLCATGDCGTKWHKKPSIISKQNICYCLCSLVQVGKKVPVKKLTTPNIAHIYKRLHDHVCILALFRQQAAKEMEKCSEHLFYPIILNHEQTWLAYVDCCWTMGNLRPSKLLLGYCRVIYLSYETY